VLANEASKNMAISKRFLLQVRLEELPLLPMMYPSLRLMFAEDYEEMEQKTARRLLRQEREQQEISS
jgi:hypothetical protein